MTECHEACERLRFTSQSECDCKEPERRKKREMLFRGEPEQQGNDVSGARRRRFVFGEKGRRRRKKRKGGSRKDGDGGQREWKERGAR